MISYDMLQVLVFDATRFHSCGTCTIMYALVGFKIEISGSTFSNIAVSS